LPLTSIKIFDSHSLKEIRSSSFRFVGDVSREDFMSLASSGPIFGRFLEDAPFLISSSTKFGYTSARTAKSLNA
jgi:hypothetical protein